MNFKSFTLIELVIVILIIGIIAVLIVPQLYKMKVGAILAQEDAIIASIKTAVHIGRMQNVLNPAIGDVWPGSDSDLRGSNPFLWLDNPPPNELQHSLPYSYDGKWMYSKITESSVTTAYILSCPHFRNVKQQAPIGYGGCQFIYNCGNNSTVWGYAVKPGDVKMVWYDAYFPTKDRGHA